MPHFDDGVEQGHLNLLGSSIERWIQSAEGRRRPQGLPEPLVEHGHVDASPPAARMCDVASVCTGALQVRVA